MSWASYSLPLKLLRRTDLSLSLPSPDCAPVTVILPVKDDLGGLLRTLHCLNELRPVPRSVIVVDDGSSVPVRKSDCLSVAKSFATNLRLVRHRKNRGAAAARNSGLVRVRGGGWVYFIDCGCEPIPTLLEDYAKSARSERGNYVAFAGPIIGGGRGLISQYMTSQGILNPPFNDGRPLAIITANALVWAPAARLIGGFDPRFPGAGGEDIDFGLRLMSVGEIGWCNAAVVRHSFQEDVADFDNRFRRYGRGTRLLAFKWRKRLIPTPFTAVSPQFQFLADRHITAMLVGYQDVGRSEPSVAHKPALLPANN